MAIRTATRALHPDGAVRYGQAERQGGQGEPITGMDL